MSLKAKIEAVIYAAEEPVTLAQLLGLLGHEGAAELAQLDRRQQSLDLPLENEGAVEAEPSEVSDLPAADPDEMNAESMLPEDQEAFVADGGEAAETAEIAEEAPAAEVVAEQTSDSEAEEDPAKRASREKAEEKRQATRLREYFRELLDELTSEYAKGDRGLEIREVAGGYRFATKPEYHDAVRGFVRSLKPPLKLTLQALETLAVVAYKQPVTAPEVSEIRGVDSGGVLGSLMTRKLVATAGRKQVIGRPILYKTTKEFLLRFGLKDINELPSIEEFEKMAGELAESEPVQEEIPMAEPNGTDHVLPPTEASPSGLEHPTQPHETADDMLHDDTHVDPAGSGTEPPYTHGAQADGTPDGSESPAVDDDSPETPEDE